MKFENENFEKEFMNWLNRKTKEEIISLLKKYEVKNKGEVKKDE